MATSKGGYVSGGFDILKAPNAPTITSVTTSIGSATVAFTAPADVGGGAITSYTITAVDESTGASTGAVGSASPITVSPPAGGTFKIRAAATNIYGPGRVSQYDTGNEIYAGASLWGWGQNSSRELGILDLNPRSSPTQVGSLITWANVSGGQTHSQAVKSDGTLWVWGAGGQGRLGIGSSPVYRSSPVQVGALTNWYQVSAGGPNGAAIKTNGTLWTWGSYTALGDGTTVDKSSPVQIGALTDWYLVSGSKGSEFFTSVKTDKTLWAWGINTRGQLGDGTRTARRSPVQVGSLTNWATVFSGGEFCAAVKTDGTLWAWGYNNEGQLGQGNTLPRSSPVQVGALTNWSKISAGSNFCISIKTDGSLWAWGKNSGGQFGNGTQVNQQSPVQSGSLTNWLSVSSGAGFTVATKTDGTMWAWGYGSSGRLGDGTSNYRSSPVQIGALTNWYQVSTGQAHTLALYGVV